MKSGNSFVNGSLARVGTIGRSLRYRNYRLFFIGRGLSLIGVWMQRMALLWLVYRLTDSKALLGAEAFCSQILTLPLAPLAGALADRIDRRKLMIASQAVAMGQALLLAVLTLTNHINIAAILGLSLVLGLVNAFDIPVRQSFIVEMLEDRNDLPNAIALNSLLFNISRVVGPALAGLVVAAANEGICFLVNALSFLAVIVSLMAMRVPAMVRPATQRSIWKHLAEGYVYAKNSRAIRAILGQRVMISFFTVPFLTLMPVFAQDILRGGPKTLGLLMTFVGFGALAGAVCLASLSNVSKLGRIVAVSTVVFGVWLMAFAWSEMIAASFVLLAFVGFGMLVQNSACNALVQFIVDDEQRGRVMGFYTVAFVGILPFGNLAAGFVAERIGAQWTVTLGGLGAVAAAMLFLRNMGSIEKALAGKA
jgi:MFS family permease